MNPAQEPQVPNLGLRMPTWPPEPEPGLPGPAASGWILRGIGPRRCGKPRAPSRAGAEAGANGSACLAPTLSHFRFPVSAASATTAGSPACHAAHAGQCRAGCTG